MKFRKRKTLSCCGKHHGRRNTSIVRSVVLHHSELENLKDIKPEVFKADYFITAMDIPGAKEIYTWNGLDKEDEYFKKATQLTNAYILCVNLLYENSDAWKKDFQKVNGLRWTLCLLGYDYLGFTNNWSSKQIPNSQQKILT